MEVIRIRKSKKDRQHDGQKKKEKRKHNYLENIHITLRSSYTNPTKNRGWTEVQKGKEFLLH
jgi:hypothetical protein